MNSQIKDKLTLQCLSTHKSNKSPFYLIYVKASLEVSNKNILFSESYSFIPAWLLSQSLIKGFIE